MKNLLDTKTILSILYLEDSQQDFEIIQELLIDAGYRVSIDRVENEKEFVSSLLRQSFDIILSDFNLPGYDAFSALRKSIEICPEVPFIVVSGTIGEVTAIELIKLGADDYILKDKPERLPYAINRALEEVIAKKALKLSEKELRKSEIMYRTLTENIPDIVTRFDTNLRHIYINSAIEKIIGTPPHSFIGKTNEELGMPTEQVSIWNEQLLHVFKTAKQRKIEFSFLTSGGVRYFSSLAVPEFSKDGKVVSVLSVARDITERKKSEVELIKAKEKAEESDNLKTAFLHNISHEIRTPMNAIVGFSSFLNDPDLPSEQRQNFTDIIVQSSNQLLAIITDIISVATIEAGQAKTNEKETNLNTICKLLNEQYKLKAQEQNVFMSLKTNLSDNDALVITDEIKLTEILANLIGNALKFTQQGTVEFGYSLEQNALKFYVEDTGIGIPPELISEIFTRFRQVETTSSRQFGGSGLGLSISKAYVELLGGQMWVTSELNKGSVFYFTIPYKKTIPSNLSINHVNSINKESNKSKTLLVAEDVDSNFVLLEVLLSGIELNLIRAKNGLEAVDICKSNPQIDLVLMDIKMPVMDGYEATQQIIEFRPDLPIIAQTAFYTENDRSKAIECGCIDFISKPFNRESFISKIKQHISK